MCAMSKLIDAMFAQLLVRSRILEARCDALERSQGFESPKPMEETDGKQNFSAPDQASVHSGFHHEDIKEVSQDLARRKVLEGYANTASAAGAGNHQQVDEESAEDGEEDSEAAALALEEEALFIAFHNLRKPWLFSGSSQRSLFSELKSLRRCDWVRESTCKHSELVSAFKLARCCLDKSLTSLVHAGPSAGHRSCAFYAKTTSSELLRLV